MQINPYLFFDGSCEEAFKFYAKVLGAKIDAMFPHAGTPAEEHVPAEWRSKIMHALLILGDQVLMASDAPPGRQDAMKGFSVSLNVDSIAEAERIYHALAEKGTVTMPDPADLLGHALRHARRPLRHALDDQLRAGGLTAAARGRTKVASASAQAWPSMPGSTSSSSRAASTRHASSCSSPDTLPAPEAHRSQRGSAKEAKPQKEHEWLHKLVGEWASEMECIMAPGQPPVKSTGSESVRSLGELWTLGEGQGEAPDGTPVKSLMTLGYDPEKQRFVGTFIASMMTHLWSYEGTLDAAGQVLTLDTLGPSFTGDGKVAKYQDIIAFESDDHRTLRSRAMGEDGQWGPFFVTAHYHRRKR